MTAKAPAEDITADAAAMEVDEPRHWAAGVPGIAHAQDRADPHTGGAEWRHVGVQLFDHKGIRPTQEVLSMTNGNLRGEITRVHGWIVIDAQDMELVRSALRQGHRHLAGGEAILLHAEGNAARFHAGDEDRDDRDEPDDGHPQGRSHRPDGRQEQDRHEQIRQIRRRAEDHRRRPPEEPLKKSAGSCADRNQPRIGAL